MNMKKTTIEKRELIARGLIREPIKSDTKFVSLMKEWIGDDDRNLDAVIEQLNAYRSSFMSTTKYPKIMCSVRLDQEQVQMIDAYIRNQKHQPSFSGVMRLALQRFLREKMYDLE